MGARLSVANFKASIRNATGKNKRIKRASPERIRHNDLQRLSPAQVEHTEGLDEHPTSAPARPEAASATQVQPVIGLEAPTFLATVISTDPKPPLATTGAKNTDKMASDEDYAAFLDKANEDPNAGASASREGKRKVELKTVDEGFDVPAVLKRAARDEFYVSDSDEPFVPVCVKGPDDVPDELTFSKLVGHPNPEDGLTVRYNVSEWDEPGTYRKLVDAVREAVNGADVMVYRIELEPGGPRYEYWIVGVDRGRMMGYKTMAILS